MFTGIISGKGKVESASSSDDSLVISSPFFASRKPKLGSSIAIDGVCLSVCEITDKSHYTLKFDLGEETRNITLLTNKVAGDFVNLEFAICAGDPLDGHVVQGHVDGVAEIAAITQEKPNYFIDFKFDKKLSSLIVKKGSIAINGVSLTVNNKSESIFQVCLIPYTIKNTCFLDYKIGDKVHIETDIMGRYLHQFFQNTFSHSPNTLKEIN